MGGIEPFIILPVAALHLPVVSGRIGADHFMPYPMFLQTFLEKGWFIPVRGKTVGELRAIVGLDTLDPAGKRLDKVFYKLRGRIGAVFLKSFYKAPSGVLINGGILEELFSDHLAVFQTDRGDKFDIYLDTLSRIIHLLIRFGNVFGIWRMDGHHVLFFEEAVKAGDGTGISSLTELDPENNETGMGIAASHIPNEFDLLRGMLVGMVMRASGTVTERIPGAIIAAFPAINILPVGFILDSGFGDAKFLSVFDEG